MQKDNLWLSIWNLLFPSHLPPSDTFILEDESKASQKHHPPADSLLYPFGCSIFCSLRFCGIGVCLSPGTILPPSSAVPAAARGCQRSRSEEKCWVALPSPNAHLKNISLANKVSALELLSLLILQCLSLSKHIHATSFACCGFLDPCKPLFPRKTQPAGNT